MYIYIHVWIHIACRWFRERRRLRKEREKLIEQQLQREQHTAIRAATRCNTLQHSAGGQVQHEQHIATRAATRCIDIYIYTHTRGGRIPSLADVIKIH